VYTVFVLRGALRFLINYYLYKKKSCPFLCLFDTGSRSTSPMPKVDLCTWWSHASSLFSSFIFENYYCYFLTVSIFILICIYICTYIYVFMYVFLYVFVGGNHMFLNTVSFFGIRMGTLKYFKK